MRVWVVWSQDRWGEDSHIDAAFDSELAAMAFAHAETDRTHALAEVERRLSAARLFFVTTLSTGDPAADQVTVGIRGVELSPRVTDSSLP